MQAPARRSPIRCIAVVEFRYLGLGTCTVETVKFWSRDPTYRTVPLSRREFGRGFRDEGAVGWWWGIEVLMFGGYHGSGCGGERGRWSLVVGESYRCLGKEGEMQVCYAPVLDCLLLHTYAVTLHCE
jgi:hypothetical protein